MNNGISIGTGVYLLSVNDRRKHLFENIWPLPGGVTYNSYLICDERTALLDTVESGSDGYFVDRVASLLGGKELDYLIVNHMEPDHSGEIEHILRRYPGVTVIGNKQTRKILASYYGDVCGQFMEVSDGDTLPLGIHTLRFCLTPWVHWPETMMTYEEREGILFSADAFGAFGAMDGGVIDTRAALDGYEDEMRRYYSNIVGKYGNMVQGALKKLSALPVRMICPLHGVVLRETIDRVVSLYDKWSRYDAENAVVVIYASMYGNTARIADYIAGQIASKGVKDIRVYDVSKTHPSYLISEIWRCRYVVLGSCAYNGGMFPLMEQLCSMLREINPKGRKLALFGSCSWSGGGVRQLKKFAEEIGWEEICESEELCGLASSEEKLSKFGQLAARVAEAVMNECERMETC